MLIFLCFIADNFNNKRPLKLDFKMIQRMMAETRALKTAYSTYKKQTDDLVAASKTLQPTGGEEEAPKTSLLRKGKRVTRSSVKGSTIARVVPALRQTTIPTRVVTRKKVVPPF